VVVAIQTIAAEVGNVEVFPAVVIEISNADALPPSLICNARHVGNIREAAPVIIAIEHGAWRPRFVLQDIERRAVDQIDIQPPVIVEVEKRATGAGGLDQVILGGGPRKMAKGAETGFACDIGKAHTRRGVG
jgi:hypothetical protein